MKKSILIGLISLYTGVFAVEGYKDIYIKSNKNIYIHTIYCGDDARNLSSFRPSVVYTNTKSIEKGTYYFSSQAGDFSLTFNNIDGQAPSLKALGILTKGQTSKKQMQKKLCLVDKNPKFPKTLNGRIAKDILKSNDPQWNKKMKNYTYFFGKPAYENGKYLSSK